MSDIIDIIERLGRDSELRHAPRVVLDRALAGEPMSAELRSALASGDREELERLLATDRDVCCMVFAPAEEAEEDGKSVTPVALSNVCCLINAPVQDDDWEEQTKAAPARPLNRAA